MGDQRCVDASAGTGEEAGDDTTGACGHRFHAGSWGGIAPPRRYGNQATKRTSATAAANPAVAESLPSRGSGRECGDAGAGAGTGAAFGNDSRKAATIAQERPAADCPQRSRGPICAQP